MPAITILQAMSHFWAPWFRDPATWAPWRAFLAALFGLPMTEAELALYRAHTGRTAPPPAEGFIEAWLVCGRRAGKSFILALIACYLAVFRDWKPFLTHGELGCIKIIATDRKQARTIHRYCRALLTQVPQLAEFVVKDGDDEIELSNGIVIEIQTASFRSVRSYTVIAALIDEIAYLRTDDTSANPDSEIIGAIRPAMATIDGAMLLCASSPYARRGELWDAYERAFGNDDADEIVWHATTREMNPTVKQSVIDRAMAKDAPKALAEFMAEFRKDIEGFLDLDLIRSAIEPGLVVRPRMPREQYMAFFDASGGRQDSCTMAIGPGR
jgi:hypothetical protein